MPLAERQSSTSSGAARFLLGGIPLWIGIVAFLSVGAIVLVGLLLRREWATVAVLAAIDAAIGAGLVLIAAIVILLVRRAQWLTLGLSALLMLVMGLGSVAALTNQPAIHRWQGQNLESSKQWAAAITQFSRAGEEPPHAPDIARLRLEWGEEFLGRGVYELAVDQFYQALEDDDSTTTADRANRDLYRLYSAWLQAGPPDDILRALSSFLDRYIQTPLCDADCQLVTRPLVAEAIYLYGESRLKLNSSGYCSQVAGDFKDLVLRYPGTSGSQKASAVLATPVTFTATVFDLPSRFLGYTAHLSAHVYPDTVNAVQRLSRDYAATIVKGPQALYYQATFTNVAPGKYNFSIDLPPGDKYEFWYWYASDKPFDAYSAVADPLCGATQSFYFD
jgi:hypothetical protein